MGKRLIFEKGVEELFEKIKNTNIDEVHKALKLSSKEINENRIKEIENIKRKENKLSLKEEQLKELTNLENRETRYKLAREAVKFHECKGCRFSHFGLCYKKIDRRETYINKIKCNKREQFIHCDWIEIYDRYCSCVCGKKIMRNYQNTTNKKWFGDISHQFKLKHVKCGEINENE